MKKIKWQYPITITHFTGDPLPQDENNPLSFERFILGRIMVEPKFGQSMKNILIAVKIKAQVEKSASNSSDLILEDSDYEALKEATENPQCGYNPATAHSVLPFMRAIVDEAETL